MLLLPAAPQLLRKRPDLLKWAALSLCWLSGGHGYAAEAPLQSVFELSKPTQTTTRTARPSFLLADQIDGQTEELMQARGHVEWRKADNQLWADALDYWPLEDQVEARGHVRYRQSGSEFSGPFLRRNLTDLTGYFERPHYLIRREIQRKEDDLPQAPGVIGNPFNVPDVRISYGKGEAERINFKGENQLEMLKATYSSCLADQRDWYMKADKITLDYDLDDGNSRSSVLFFKEVPVFYWPSISFPVSGNSRSGLLPPTFMASTQNGMDLTVPYYFNLAPNYDLLLNTRLIGQRGTQFGTEIRYLDHLYQGELRYEYLSDSKYGAGRQAYMLNHTHNLGQNIMANIQWNGVTDGDYMTDLSTRLVQTSQVLMPRQISLNYNPTPWINTTTRYLSYQTLKSDFVAPYALEPQIIIQGWQPNYYGTEVRFFGQVTNFTHATQIHGQRFVAYPQITLPYETASTFFRPKIGLHARQYNLDTQGIGNATESVVIPTLSLDTGMVFERDTQFWGRDTLQTLEPRLFYVNIPYQDQSRLPIFDTGIADFNFAQIFQENRYLGQDRVNDANQLTAAVTSRFIDAETGAERMKVLLGQRYYFKKQEVTLNSIYPNSPTEVSRTDDFSSIIAAFSGLIAYRTYLDSAVEYSYKEEKTMRFALGTRYQPSYGKVLTAGYRFNRDQATLTSDIEQYDIAGQWPISGRWYAVGRYNVSIQDRRPLETILGFEYNAGCWMARMVSQRIETVPDNPNTVLFFQLEFNDFAQLGTNPLQLLRRTIPGYGKLNEIDSGSLIQ